MGLKITVDEIKGICNLTDVKKNDLIASKMLLVDDLVKDISVPIIYADVEDETADQLVKDAFYNAFAYFVYAEILEFLNTNTAGNGIVKSTGFSDNRIELLSQDETEKRRNKLEFKAYNVIRKYLNTDGLKRYSELKLWDDLQKAGDPDAKSRLLGQSNNRICRMSII